MYHVQFSPDFPLPTPTMQRDLYSCVEALRIAEQRLGDVGKFAPGDGGEFPFGSPTIQQARAIIDLHARVLQELIGGVMPSMPDRVFKAIRDFENIYPWNPPHVESAILALHLAFRCLKTAVDSHSGDQTDELYELLLGAEVVVGLARDMIDGCILIYEQVDLLDAIIEGNAPTTSRAREETIESYQQLLNDYPAGNEYWTPDDIRQRIAQLNHPMSTV